MLTVKAPAKINLTLEVLGKRNDGFHEIRSIIQTISLSDVLRFMPNKDIVFKSESPEWLPQKSLISKTVDLLRKHCNCSKGVLIEIDKRIPLMSGLGGDSSGAAATLVALNEMWLLGLPPPKMAELVVQLGSDVTFFLSGGTARVTGRGEQVNSLPPLSTTYIVLVVPSIPRQTGKTARLYASLQPGHYTDGQITERLSETIKSGNKLKSSQLFNTFENVTFEEFPELITYQKHILKTGASNVHLAGSGPVLFTLLNDGEQANDLYTRLKQQNMEAYLTETTDGST